MPGKKRNEKKQSDFNELRFLKESLRSLQK